ncbi:interleukin-5 receptor subunit alpha-like isoform X2 [Leucoraja erinacea]|uniref:interleukin-5 receptor subunit alpha-like isoform X2 n=1 Tax=Leucoraja erinaceus TaxID=7782 RepID=UPI0024537D1E|nr:interleukin-5 receptor subunit alpha-like isoform X2 [Leucoraja erinacea]
MVTKSLLLLAALWTTIVNAETMEETIKRNPPRNISISHGSLGEYTLSWEGNCTCTEGIEYQLEYTYLDSKDNEMEMYYLQENQKVLDLELHRGLQARVRLTYGDNPGITSNWTERTFDLSGELFASVDNLICIFYGKLYMNCSWDVTEHASEGAQFNLSYRERNPSEVYNCTDYLVDGGRNIGCVNHKYRLGEATETIICISEVNKKDKLPYCRIVKPGSFYKLDSPMNVTINKSTDEVEWTLPKFGLNIICYNFQLNITNLNDRNSKLENVTTTNHFISRDHTKKYSVHVRVVVNDNCLESSIWSDWSKPLIIDPDGRDMSFPTIVAVVAVILVALVLLLVLVCMKNGLTRVSS